MNAAKVVASGNGFLMKLQRDFAGRDLKSTDALKLEAL